MVRIEGCLRMASADYNPLNPMVPGVKTAVTALAHENGNNRPGIHLSFRLMALGKR